MAKQLNEAPQETTVDSEPRDLTTVEGFAEKYPAWSQASLRSLLLNAQDRHSSRGPVAGNGLLQAGAVLRLGRRVLISESRFFAWVSEQQKQRRKAVA